MTLRDDINKAISGLAGINFRFLGPHEWRDILDQVAEAFLKGGTRDLKYVWLWDQLREEISASQPDDSIDKLARRLSEKDSYWFIASDQHGKYWVATADMAGILTVLREMYHFEYYVVDHRMTRLMCENHHGILIEASSRITNSAAT